MYDSLRATVIFAIGRVVQDRKLLSKEPIKLHFKTKTSCAAQHNSEVAARLMDYNLNFRVIFKLSKEFFEFFCKSMH